MSTPSLKPTKTEPCFRKLNSKLGSYISSHSPLGQSTNLLPVTAPIMERSYIHTFPLVMDWANMSLTSSEIHVPTVPSPDNCVMTPVVQESWMVSAFSQMFKPSYQLPPWENISNQIMVTRSLIIHDRNQHDCRFKAFLP